jgi:hypothetical protein
VLRVTSYSFCCRGRDIGKGLILNFITAPLLQTTCHFVPKILTIREWVHFFGPLCILRCGTALRGSTVWHLRSLRWELCISYIVAMSMYFLVALLYHGNELSLWS